MKAYISLLLLSLIHYNFHFHKVLSKHSEINQKKASNRANNEFLIKEEITIEAANKFKQTNKCFYHDSKKYISRMYSYI